MLGEQKVRVGIIGLGAIGHRIAKQLHHRPDTEVVVVCDLNESLALQIAAELGGVQATPDYHTMLEGDLVDLVYVGVPPKLHHTVAKDVLRAHKHIFCEKPLALHLDEARDMLRQARDAGVVHALNLPLYGDPGVRTFAHHLHSGHLGTLRHVDVQLVFPKWPRLWQVNPWIGRREQGGMIREVSPHLFDVILREFGPVTRVFARMDYPEDALASEITAFGLLELASGQTVSVRGVAHVDCAEVVSLTAYGTVGTLALRDWTTPMASRNGTPLEALPVDGQRPDWSTQLAAAVRGKKANPEQVFNHDLCDFSVGVRIQEVLDAWERSADSEVWVTVDRQQ